MSYRDDLTASHARADALETELAAARERIAKLEGKAATQALARIERGPTALARTAKGSRATRFWLGAPIALELCHELAGELPDKAYTEVVERIRVLVGNVGAVSILPGSLAWAATNPSNGVGPFVNVYVTIRDGRTVIRAEEKLGNLAGVIFGAVGGGVGGGGIAAPIALVAVAPVLVPVALTVWLGGTYAICRAIMRNRASARAERLETLVNDLVAIAERHIAAGNDRDRDPGKAG